MDNKNMTGYLKKIIDLETTIYTQTSIINSLTNRIGSLGYSYTYKKPLKPAGLNIMSGVRWLLLPPTVIGFVISLLKFALFDVPFSEAIAANTVPGILIGAGILLWNIYSAAPTIEEKEKYEENLKQYYIDVENNRKRVNRELNERNKLQSILATVKKQNKETAHILQSYYARNIIFPKYQNLIAVCSFYEYYLSGRCATLTGHEGAYNIYETEARLDRIITRLDTVIENLEQIKDSQWGIYNAIKEGNRTSQQILNESVRQSKLAEQTVRSAELSAYYSRISAINSEANIWIGLADYIK